MHVFNFKIYLTHSETGTRDTPWSWGQKIESNFFKPEILVLDVCEMLATDVKRRRYMEKN